MRSKHQFNTEIIPNISSKSLLSQFKNTNLNQQSQFSFGQVIIPQSNYSYRAMRDDGNSFYRIVAFLYLIRAPLQHYHKCFRDVQLICKDMPLSFQQDVNWKEQLYNMWQEYLRPIASRDNKQQELVKIFNNYVAFDMLIIAYFRSVNYHYIRYNQQQFEPYCRRGVAVQLQRIEKFNQKSQEIELLSLASALNIKITLIYVQKNNFQSVCFNQQGRDEEFYLFSMLGEYSIAYSNDTWNLKSVSWRKIFDDPSLVIQQNEEKKQPNNSVSDQSKDQKQDLVNNFINSYILRPKKQPKNQPFKQINSSISKISEFTAEKSKMSSNKPKDPRRKDFIKPKPSKQKQKQKIQKNTSIKDIGQDFKYMKRNIENNTIQKKAKVQSNFKSSSTIKTPTQHFKIKDKLERQFQLSRLSMQIIVFLTIAAIIGSFIYR